MAALGEINLKGTTSPVLRQLELYCTLLYHSTFPPGTLSQSSIFTVPPAAMSYFPVPNDWAVMYNNYTGSGTFLAAISPSGGLLQMTSNISPSAYWQILSVNGVNYIRNKAAGASLQLDVILSNQISMPSLQKADTSAKGQQWSFLSDVASGTEFWNVESAGASGVQLDTYSDTLQPFFEFGGHSGQMWSFSSVGKVNDVAFSTVAGVSYSRGFYAKLGFE